MKKLLSTILSVTLFSMFALASPAEAKNCNKSFNRHDNGKHLGWYKGKHNGWDKGRCSNGGGGGWNNGKKCQKGNGGWNGGGQCRDRDWSRGDRCSNGNGSGWNSGSGRGAWNSNNAFAGRGVSKHNNKLNKKLANQNSTFSRKQASYASSGGRLTDKESRKLANMQRDIGKTNFKIANGRNR